MTDRPIIFSAPMVRALLDFRKTQTRRVLQPQPEDHLPGEGAKRLRAVALARYDVGDRLWVKEAWSAVEAYDDLKPSEMSGEEAVRYSADGYMERWGWPPCGRRWGRYRHARFMPRWASRLTLLVTQVRVQRLQEISEEDAQAEGITWQAPTDEDRAWAKRFAEENGCGDHIDGVWIAPGTRQGYGASKEERDRPQWGPTAAFAFRCLWNSLHGPDAWDANPWVCAISFTVEKRNIDQVTG